MRKFIGAVVLLAWLVIYIAVAAAIGDRVASDELWIKAIYFPVAGMAWVLPLRPLLRWMHSKDAPKETSDV